MPAGAITGIQLVSPGEPLQSGFSIAWDDRGLITEVAPQVGATACIDGDDALYALPGFIDIHTHGAAGRDLADATPEAVAHIAEAKLREGVTTFLPTTWTTSAEHLQEMAHAAATYREDEKFARTPGLHIEGPYLNPEQAGAQSLEHMRLPDTAEIFDIAAVCPVSLVSLAVEMEGAIPFLSAMSDSGVITSAAHSAATMSDFRRAKAAGLRHLTHFCNQMSPLHHREIGLVGAGLLDADIRLELICDTIHLCEDMLQLIFATKPLDRLMLITDSVAASHLGDGEYQQGGSTIIVKDGAARLPGGQLAGSALQYHHGLAHVARVTGLPLEQLVQTTSWNQAQSLGLIDRGALRPGMLADVVLLDGECEVVAVVKGGEVVYQA